MQPHFSICILSSERPLDAPLLGVAARLPSSDLGDDRSAIRQTPIKTLAIKDADFNFSHVEPAGMLRGVMDTTRRSGVRVLRTPSTSSKHLRKWVLRLSMTRWMQRALV